MMGELLHQAIKLNYESDIRDGVSISSIGYCELQTQNLFIRGIKKDIGPANLLAMRTGTATHDDLFKLLWKWRGELEGFTYKFKEREVNLPTPAHNNLKGHLDIFVEINGVEYVVDLKVIDEGAYSHITDIPRAHERDQIMCYAAALGVKNCLLLYLCKGGRTKGQFKEFPFIVDYTRVSELTGKYDRIFAGKAVKPYESPDDSWECGYCPFYSECWGTKSFASKKDGVLAIPEELEEHYLAEKLLADEHYERAEEYKEKITSILDGKRGEGSAITITYVPISKYQKVDTAKLKMIAPDVFKACSKETSTGGFYKVNMRGR